MPASKLAVKRLAEKFNARTLQNRNFRNHDHYTREIPYTRCFFYKKSFCSKSFLIFSTSLSTKSSLSSFIERYEGTKKLWYKAVKSNLINQPSRQEVLRLVDQMSTKSSFYFRNSKLLTLRSISRQWSKIAKTSWLQGQLGLL